MCVDDAWANHLVYASWFIAGQGVDLAAQYPEAGSKASDFAYLYFVQEYMPVGMVGLFDCSDVRSDHVFHGLWF